MKSLFLKKPVASGLDNDPDDVRNLGKALRATGDLDVKRGASDDGANGFLSAKMMDAVTGLQAREGLRVDGLLKPGGETEQIINNRLSAKPRGAGLLHSPATALTGPVGDAQANRPVDVVAVKRQMAALGFMKEDPFDKPSPFIDAGTDQAIRAFQGRKGLKTDGLIAPGGPTETALSKTVKDFFAKNRKTFEAWHEAQREQLQKARSEARGTGKVQQEARNGVAATGTNKEARRGAGPEGPGNSREDGPPKRQIEIINDLRERNRRITVDGVASHDVNKSEASGLAFGDAFRFASFSSTATVREIENEFRRIVSPYLGTEEAERIASEWRGNGGWLSENRIRAIAARSTAALEGTPAGVASAIIRIIIRIFGGARRRVPPIGRRPRPKTGSSDGESAGQRFPRRIQERERRDARGRCRLCGRRTQQDAGNPDTGETDHAIPRSQGGNASQDNAQHTCRTCNRQKGARTTQEFLNQRNPHP